MIRTAHGRTPHAPRGLTFKVVIAISLLFTIGCSTRNDPRYNRYAPNDGEPTILKRLERGRAAVSEGLDAVDERFQNTINR